MSRLLVAFSILISIAAWGQVAKEVSLSRIDDFEIDGTSVIDYVIGNPKMIAVKKEGNKLIVSAKYSAGETYLILLTPNESINYLIQIKDQTRSTVLSKNKRTVYGTLVGKTGYTKGQSHSPYTLGLDMKINLTELSTFSFGINHYYNLYKYDTELFYWSYRYKDVFLTWSRFNEPTAAVSFYQGSRLRGYSLVKKNNHIEFGYYNANRFYNDEENKDENVQGVYLRDYYENFSYRLSLSNTKDIYIPTASTAFAYKNAYVNLGYSEFQKQFLFNINAGLNFNKGSEDFTLRNINTRYLTAPEGSYGLFATNNNFYESYGGELNFSNQESKKTQEEMEENFDFLSGIISTTLGYDYRLVNTNDTTKYRGFIGYGKMDRVSLSGVVDYTFSNISAGKTRSFLYSPRFSVFFYGDKQDGYSIRNEYSSLATEDYKGDVFTKYSNTLGVYRNTKKYVYGVYTGTAVLSSSLADDKSSKLFGGEVNYYFQDTLSGGAKYQKTTQDGGGQEDTLNLRLRKIYKKDLNIQAGVRYVSKEDAVGTKLENSEAFASFTWNFGYGDEYLVNSLTDFKKSLKGTVYLDKNFNGQQDEGETPIGGVKLSVIKAGADKSTTSSDGSFSFDGFSSKENVSINVDDPRYLFVTNADFDMRSSHSENLGLYEYESKKMTITANSGQSLPDSNISFSCEINGIKIKKELYSEYTLVHLPKGKACSPQLSDASDSNMILKDYKDENGFIAINIQLIPKQVYIEFTNKIATISINKNKIPAKNNAFSYEIKPFDGALALEMPKNCEISPSNYKKTYKTLKNQNFFKISCF